MTNLDFALFIVRSTSHRWELLCFDSYDRMDTLKSSSLERAVSTDLRSLYGFRKQIAAFVRTHKLLSIYCVEALYWAIPTIKATSIILIIHSVKLLANTSSTNTFFFIPKWPVKLTRQTLVECLRSIQTAQLHLLASHCPLKRLNCRYFPLWPLYCT